MSTFYEAKRDLTVQPLMARYGTSMTLLVPAAGTYTASTGAFTPGTEASHTVQGLIGTYRKSRRGSDAIQAKTQFVYLSPSGMTVVPVPGHKLRIGGVDYEITDVDTISPGGTAVLYQLEVRLP